VRASQSEKKIGSKSMAKNKGNLVEDYLYIQQRIEQRERERRRRQRVGHEGGCGRGAN